MIYSADAERLLEQDIGAFDWAYKNESVTNLIKSYRAPNPDITIRQQRNDCALSLTDDSGVIREFLFSCPRGRGRQLDALTVK